MEPGSAAPVAGTNRDRGGLCREPRHAPSLGRRIGFHAGAQLPAFEHSRYAGGATESHARSGQYGGERLPRHPSCKSFSVLLCNRGIAGIVLSGDADLQPRRCGRFAVRAGSNPAGTPVGAVSAVRGRLFGSATPDCNLVVSLAPGSIPEASEPLRQLRGELHILEVDRRFCSRDEIRG